MSIHFGSAAKASNSPDGYSPQRLFLASCIALIATAMTFAIRGDIAGALSKRFSLSNERIGDAYSPAFFGFTIAIFVGGQLLDVFGAGAILGLAFATHVAGLLTAIFATGFWTLWTGWLLVGLGNGLVEAAVNPLVATMYSHDKVHRLNRLHAWFPGGIVIGGLTAYGLTLLHIGWQVKVATILIPVAVYGVMLLGQRYPRSERVQSNVSTKEMYGELLRPLFILWLFCMLLTATTELANEQWLPSIVNKVVGNNAILYLVLINGLMYVGRSFAGPIVHRLSPIGLLCGSALFSLIGLVGLSYATTTATIFVATVLFAVGVCYFWPTMLGVTSERFPKGGSLLLGVMGAAGMLSVAIVLPVLGHFLDVSGNNPQLTFRYMAAVPLVLLAIFTAIYLRDRARGGYRPVQLSAASEPETAAAHE